MTAHDQTDPRKIGVDSEDEGGPEPDVVPEDAEARGAQTIPGVTQTGQTTPPISGWGEVPADDEAPPAD